MLRYRVASLLLPFFLLAPALHGQLLTFRWSYVAGGLALCACYIVATSLNDVFDFEVDRINHPGAKDRPLVTGDATARQLLFLAIVAAALALLMAIATGPVSVIVVAGSLLLNVAYSVPPLRLCARPLAAPPVLAFAYVVLPYGLGLAATGRTPEWIDAMVVACFVVLFAGRMLLKDFRDRSGDAAFGKRTFLLTYGKRATVIVVLICVAVGDALLTTVLPRNPVLVVAIESYFVAIALQLFRLWQADNADDERVAIALGARMGNAVVLTWLGFLLLPAAGAAAAEQAVFVVALAAMFWFVFVYLAARPQEAVIAYRG
jgi:4-hydroxybenzoate polyprenyltransferase